MGEVTFAAAVLVWGLLPGLLLLWAAGVGWSRAERAAAAAGISLALVAGAAYATELAGLPVRPLPVFAVILVICAVVFALRRRTGRAAHDEEHGWPDDLPAGLWWAPWLVWLTPLVIVAQLAPVSAEALLPPSLHDGLDHANWFRLIYELGSLNPHEVLAPPLTAAGEPTYYPWGMHAWAALMARTTTVDPVIVLMRAMVLTSAAVPLSVYVFTAMFTGRGFTAMAAALLSLVFWWVPYQMWGWGGYPLLAGAVAALPATRLALWAVERGHRASIAAAGLCMAGLLLLHPSQLFVALMMGAVAGVTLAAGKVCSWRAAAVMVLLCASACAALMMGGRLWQPLGEFLEKAAAIGVRFSGDPRYRWPIGTFFDTGLPLPDAARFGLAALAAIGAVVAIVNPRVRPLLALHLVFGLLVLAARYESWLTSLWYHIPERIWYAQAASLPALAAVGIGAGVRVVARAARRWIDLSRWQIVIWAILLWALFPPLHETFVPWANWRLYHAVHRNPHLSITDRRVLADYAWMRANIPRGELIFNAPADWGLPLPFTGHRTVFWSGGFAVDPSTRWNDLLALMRRGDPYTSRAGAELSAMGIRYVYAARLSPALEAAGRLPLEGTALRDAAAFELLYESPTAMILKIEDAAPSLLGLRDSDRVRFEGFYRIEEDGRRQWRWTAGKGLLFINTAGQAGQECYLRVLGPDAGTFDVRLAGAALEYTARGHRIPREHNTGGVLPLEVTSPTFVPQSATGDDRVLGVRVTNIAFSCAG